MNQKKAKTIRKHCKFYGLPKSIYRKIKKTTNEYNLDISQTLYLIDRASDMYYTQMDKINKKLEKELENAES